MQVLCVYCVCCFECGAHQSVSAAYEAVVECRFAHVGPANECHLRWCSSASLAVLPTDQWCAPWAAVMGRREVVVLDG